MSTYKQKVAAYSDFVRAEKKMRSALHHMDNMKIINCPSQYSDGFWIHFNKLIEIVDQMSKEPLGKALQDEIGKEVKR